MYVDRGIRCLTRSIFCKVASLIEIEIFIAVILVAMVAIFIKNCDNDKMMKISLPQLYSNKVKNQKPLSDLGKIAKKE